MRGRAFIGEDDPRAQAALAARAHAALTLRAALYGTEETGAQTVAALPWLAEVAPSALARTAWGLQPELCDRPPVLSLRWRLRLEAAVRRAAHYGYSTLPPGDAGAGVALVLDLIRGDWREWRDGTYSADRPYVAFLPTKGPRSRPLSLGAIAVCARRQANELRRRHLLRDGRSRRRRLRSGAAS